MTIARLLSAWRLKSEGVILPEERLPGVQTVIVGLQHVVAMFGATVLAPLLPTITSIPTLSTIALALLAIVLMMIGLRRITAK